VQLWALPVPVVTWSHTTGTELASLGNVHYVGVGITAWGNGDIRASDVFGGISGTYILVES